MKRTNSESSEISIEKVKMNFQSPGRLLQGKKSRGSGNSKHSRSKNGSIDVSGVKFFSDELVAKREPQELPGSLRVKIEDLHNLLTTHTSEVDEIAKRYLNSSLQTPKSSSQSTSLHQTYSRLVKTNNKPKTLEKPPSMTPMTMDTIPTQQPMSENIKYLETAMNNYIMPVYDNGKPYGQKEEHYEGGYLMKSPREQQNTSSHTAHTSYFAANVTNYSANSYDVGIGEKGYASVLDNSTKGYQVDAGLKYEPYNAGKTYSAFIKCSNCGREFLKLNENDIGEHICYLCR